jgi:hypothetical protein
VVEDVEEDEDVVEESSLEEEDEGSGDESDGDGGRQSEVRGDRIEVFSPSFSSERSEAVVGVEAEEPGQMGDRSEDEHAFSERRSVKRRRISISPLASQGSPVAWQDDGVDNGGDGDAAVPDVYEEPGEAEEEEEEQESHFDSEGSDLVEVNSPTRDKSLQQPTFRAPPRFKALEDDGLDGMDGLPPAFSPQRRGGPRYTAGGLASELQGWLSEVKGWASGGTDGWSGPRFSVVLEEVRPGRRMYLTRYAASPLDDEGKTGYEGGRLVLAGEGTLTGLGQSADVKIGSVVEVRHPVWDIELEGFTWLVACDWSVK